MKSEEKGISPLIATVMLLVFALILGIVVMTVGRVYLGGEVVVEHGTEETVHDVCSPLEALQVAYASGQISEEEYQHKLGELG